jgi:hypothetical protein
MSESTAASIEELAAELDELRQQQAATREILRVIRRSRATPQPVFETIASAAMSLCRASVANVFTFDTNGSLADAPCPASRRSSALTSRTCR